MVCLVEDLILAESMSIQEACKIVARKMDVSRYIARQWAQVARCEGQVLGSGVSVFESGVSFMAVV